MKNTVVHLWWLRHRAGGVPPRRNAVCRSSDRWQQISLWSWFVVALLTLPLVSVTVVPAIADSWRPPPMQPVTAVVDEVREVSPVLGPGADVIHRTYDVRARWTTPAGAVRHGSVTTSDKPNRGDTIRIWTTTTGDQVAGRQPRNSPAVDRALLIADAAVCIGLTGCGAHRLLVWRLDRRRLRAWDDELGKLLTRH